MRTAYTPRTPPVLRAHTQLSCCQSHVPAPWPHRPTQWPWSATQPVALADASGSVDSEAGASRSIALVLGVSSELRGSMSSAEVVGQPHHWSRRTHLCVTAGSSVAHTPPHAPWSFTGFEEGGVWGSRMKCTSQTPTSKQPEGFTAQPQCQPMRTQWWTAEADPLMEHDPKHAPWSCAGGACTQSAAGAFRLWQPFYLEA